MFTQPQRLAVILVIGILPSLPGPTSAQSARKSGGEGNVDTEASRIYVFVGKKGFGHEHGVEGKVKEGTIELGKRGSAGKLVFDMASLNADTEAARKYVKLDPEFDQNKDEINSTMKGKAVLDVEKHPTATFEIDSAQESAKQGEDGAKAYELKGNLTLHGKSKPLTVIAKAAEEKDGRVRLTGDFKIKQSDFGIKPYSAGFGLAAVTDELVIYGALRVASSR
jgi:polyisoprenoid-binding protein YceI